MNSANLVLYLALVTLAAGVVYGAIQMFKVRKAKKNHTHSAITEGRPEQRSDAPAPGVQPQP